MPLNKPVHYNKCCSSDGSIQDHSCPHSGIFNEQILVDIDEIIFTSNPASNTRLLHQIQSRDHIDDYFINTVSANIRTLDTTDQVINTLTDNLDRLSVQTADHPFERDEEANYQFIADPNLFDEDEDDDEEEEEYDDDEEEEEYDDDEEEEEYDDDDDYYYYDRNENIEDQLMDEIELHYLYRNTRVQWNHDDTDDYDSE
jgi:hypothetical protein